MGKGVDKKKQGEVITIEHAKCLKELVVLETGSVKLIQKLWSAWQQIHRSVLGALGEGESVTI